MANIWEKIKNFFDGKSDRKDPPQQREVEIGEEERRKENELNAWLQSVDEAYRQKERDKIKWVSDLMPEDPGYSYRTYEGETLDALLENARKESRAEQDDKSEQLDKAYRSDAQKKEQKRAETEEETALALEKLFADAETQKKQTDRKMLDRGMGRSSVPQAVKERIEEISDRTAREKRAQGEAESERLAAEIAALEKERDDALSALDVKYAEQTQKKLDAVKSDYDKQLRAIAEYNEKIDRQKVDYAKKREDAIEKQLKEYEKQLREQELFEAQNGYVGEKAAEYDARLNKALEFYRSLPADTARKMIAQNDRLRTYLGRNYTKLLSRLFADVG